MIPLQLVELRQAPRTHGLPALAWTVRGRVYVVRPFHRFFFSFGRLIHECEHVTQKLGNEMHVGHTWHFCGRSWHAVRLWPTRCTSGISYSEAVDMLRVKG